MQLKLAINQIKTKLIIFSNRQIRNEVKIMISDDETERVYETRFFAMGN